MDYLSKIRTRLERGLGLGTQCGPIGLELSQSALHLVQLRRTGSDIAIQAFASSSYNHQRSGGCVDNIPNAQDLGLAHNQATPSGSCGGELSREQDAAAALASDRAKLKVLVNRVLKDADFSGKQCVAAMPASLARVLPVSYQVRPGESDAAAIGALMAERLGDASDDLVIDYMPVQTLANDTHPGSDEPGSSASNERLALVAVAREESVVEFVENLQHAGLDVVALEIGPIAIHRLVVAMQKNAPAQNTLVLNCGRDKSYLTVVADERLLADDQIEVGELDFVREVASRLELPDDLAQRLVSGTDMAATESDESSRMLTQIVKPLLRKLVHEVERGLVYANAESRGARANQVYLLGSLARWNGAAGLLESMLDVPVKTIPSPMQLFGHETDDGSPELAVATGLALKLDASDG